MCVSWFEFDLVVSICQVIRYKDFSEDAYPRCVDYPQKAQFEESVYVYFCAYFSFYVAMHPSPHPALHNIYFIHPWHDIAHLC